MDSVLKSNQKQCSRCKDFKSLKSFHKDKNRNLGITPACKKCRAIKTDLAKDLDQKRKKLWYLANKELTIQRSKIWALENKERDRKLRNRYKRQKRKINPLYKLKENLRGRLLSAFKVKSWKKDTRFNSYIGCSKEELFIFIESKFKEGMNWNNYGLRGWHVDHVIPLVSAKSEEEMYKLAHYTNLQPLWAKENLSKGSKCP